MTVKFSRKEMINDFINLEMDLLESNGVEEACRIFKLMASTLGKDEGIIGKFEETLDKELYKEIITEYYNNYADSVLEFEHVRLFDNKYDS